MPPENISEKNGRLIVALILTIVIRKMIFRTVADNFSATVLFLFVKTCPHFYGIKHIIVKYALDKG